MNLHAYCEVAALVAFLNDPDASLTVLPDCGTPGKAHVILDGSMIGTVFVVEQVAAAGADDTSEELEQLAASPRRTVVRWQEDVVPDALRLVAWVPPETLAMLSDRAPEPQLFALSKRVGAFRQDFVLPNGFTLAASGAPGLYELRQRSED